MARTSSGVVGFWRPAPGALLSDSVKRELVLTPLTATFLKVMGSDPISPSATEDAVDQELVEAGCLRKRAGRRFRLGMGFLAATGCSTPR